MCLAALLLQTPLIKMSDGLKAPAAGVDKTMTDLDALQALNNETVDLVSELMRLCEFSSGRVCLDDWKVALCYRWGEGFGAGSVVFGCGNGVGCSLPLSQWNVLDIGGTCACVMIEAMVL